MNFLMHQRFGVWTIYREEGHLSELIKNIFICVSKMRKVLWVCVTDD